MNNMQAPALIPVTQGALRALRKTRGWVLFLAIVGVIGAVFSGVLLLVGIGLLALQGWAGILIVVEGAIFFVLTVLFAVFWFGYSGALGKISATDENINEALEQAFVRQRRLWVLQGAILIILVVLTIAAAIVVPIIVQTHPNLLTNL